MNLKILLIAILVSVMAFCGIVSADSTTVSGTLESSAVINDLGTTQALGSTGINTEKFSTFDAFTVDSNAATGWTIKVSGAKLAATSPVDTATNALKLYYNNADGTDPSTSMDLPSTAPETAQFSGTSGAALPRAIKFSQTFTSADSPSTTYSASVTLEIAAT